MKNKSVKRELNPIQQSLFSKLNDIMLVDQRRLSARIHGIGKIKSQEAQQAVAAEIQLQIEQAQLRVENRKSAVKNPIVFPESLPVSQRKAEIQKLLSEHQVIVVAGETGSGKTTQLPKDVFGVRFRQFGHDWSYSATANCRSFSGGAYCGGARNGAWWFSRL